MTRLRLTQTTKDEAAREGHIEVLCAPASEEAKSRSSMRLFNTFRLQLRMCEHRMSSITFAWKDLAVNSDLVPVSILVLMLFLI
ncbi:hypothetical protein EVAR_91594_1 [Eumeta japonica]|uniref:Uncharacterized protein n=1 Tax=Eumeta variegata TaxID=151549 RepID=A0A4C1UWI1_EUMVA|nr:hypothetical protein EVAR_91594_1 [Eumeta japonica]